jgi:hypothetical protein
MDSLQVGNSRILHDTTTSFWQPYNIVTNAQSSIGGDLPTAAFAV